MKLVKSLTIATLLLGSASVCAIQPYVGIKYNWSRMAFENNQKRFEVGKVHKGIEGTVGFKVNECIATEFSAYKLNSPKGRPSKMSTFHIAFDALVSHPVFDNSSIFGGLGVGAGRISYKTIEDHHLKAIKYHPRLVGGMDLGITENAYFRFKTSLEGINKPKKEPSYKYSSKWTSGLGLVYLF